MASRPILYYVKRSAPCRAVLMAAKAIGVDLDLKVTETAKEENRTPEFLKMNPQHTIPVLNDNGSIIVDSHVINCYLSDKYAKDDKLYPKDLVKRAQIDARMYFDAAFLFARIRAYLEPVFYFDCPEVSQDKKEYFELTLPRVESFLENSQYICGNEITLADFSFMATLSTVAPFDEKKYPKLNGWMKRMTQIPHYDITNGEGVTIFQETVERKLKENRLKAQSKKSV